jgi:hypothetical protein
MKYRLENQPEKPHEIQRYFWLSRLTIPPHENSVRRTHRRGVSVKWSKPLSSSPEIERRPIDEDRGVEDSAMT